MSKQSTREISYAQSAQSRAGKVLISALENSTGRIQLIKRADGYEQEVEEGADFWNVMTDRFGLSLDILDGKLENIPKDGPLILMANHPYGILDGLIMGHILNRTRRKFRILANSVFHKAPDINDIILPISFDKTKQAIAQNISTRREALSNLSNGGAIGIFPGGTVSTSAKPFGPPMDPAWRTFTAKLIAKSDAAVVPMYFDGSNSRMFQLASHAHPNLRLALLIKEFKRRVDEPVKIAIGKPIPRSNIAPYYKDPKAMMDFLRRSTYELAPKPLSSLEYGFEFEDKWKQKENGAG